jgi:Ca2+-binding EF-hand superfamily protein
MSVVDIFRAMLHGEAVLNQKRLQLCAHEEFDIWLLFLLLDNTSCGVVTPDGFSQLYGELCEGKRISNSDVALLFRRYDLQLNGSVGFVDLCRAFAPCAWDAVEGKLRMLQSKLSTKRFHSVTNFADAWDNVEEGLRGELAAFLTQELEFCVGVNRMCHALERDHVDMIEVFHELDRDDNGFVGRDELAQYLAAHGVQCEPLDLAMAFRRFDDDNDNRVNYIELSSGFMAVDSMDSAVSHKHRLDMVDKKNKPVSSQSLFASPAKKAPPRAASSNSNPARASSSFSSSSPSAAASSSSSSSSLFVPQPRHVDPKPVLSSSSSPYSCSSAPVGNNISYTSNQTVTTRLPDNHLVAITPTKINGVSSVVISFPDSEREVPGLALSAAQRRAEEREEEVSMDQFDFSRDFSAIKLHEEASIFRGSSHPQLPGHSTHVSKDALTMKDLMSPSKQQPHNDTKSRGAVKPVHKLSESVYREQSALADLYREQPLHQAASPSRQVEESTLLQEISEAANRVATSKTERAALHAALHCLIQVQVQVEALLSAFWVAHPRATDAEGVFLAILEGACDRTQTGFESRQGHVLFGDDVLGFINDVVTPEHVKQWLRQVVSAGSGLRLTARAEPGASREDVTRYFAHPDQGATEVVLDAKHKHKRSLDEDTLRGLIVQLVVLESFAEQVRNNLTRRHKFRFLPCFTQIDYNNNGICSLDEILEYLNDAEGTSSYSGGASSSYLSLRSRSPSKQPQEEEDQQQQQQRNRLSASMYTSSTSSKRTVRRARGLRDHLQRKKLAQSARDIPSPVALRQETQRELSKARAAQYDEHQVGQLLRRFKCSVTLSYSNFMAMLLPTN